VIVTSVLVHGLTVTPLLNWRQSLQKKREEREKQES